ncbi:MAG: hypothetical protein QXY62_05975 [Candidatus Altiarchaeota archaeon]
MCEENLIDSSDLNSPERVKYLPQNFFEQLTNNLETYEFEKTLGNIVFAYLPEEKRLGKSSFEELIKSKKIGVEKAIENKKYELSEFNEEIISLEKKSHPNYKKQIEEQISIKERELEEHLKIKPKEIQNPSNNLSWTEKSKQLFQTLENNNKDLKNIEKEIETKRSELNVLSIEINELNNIKQELEIKKQELEVYIVKNKERFEHLGLNINGIISFDFKIDLIDKKIGEDREKEREIKKKIDELEKNKNNMKSQIENIKNQLSEPQRQYQKYLEDLKEWERKKRAIEGSINTPNTLNWYKHELNFLDEKLSQEILNKRKQRLEIVKEIHEKKIEMINFYKEFKEPVMDEINRFGNLLQDYRIKLDVSLLIKNDFYDNFLRYINQKVKGSFRGEREGKEILEKLVKDRNYEDWEVVKNLLDEIINHLEEDKREELRSEKRFIKDQILNEENWLKFYNYLFSLDYIEPAYELTLSNKKLTELSPGERGALLIVFYLLLDKSDIPLIIDQPEENLDNETVYKMLTHFMKLTKKRRQLILVTHNPNLAIVGDAEQLILVHIDKVNENKFSFESGSIENPSINKRASDVLEGTLKAFDIRRLKYIRKQL